MDIRNPHSPKYTKIFMQRPYNVSRRQYEKPIDKQSIMAKHNVQTNRRMHHTTSLSTHL